MSDESPKCHKVFKTLTFDLKSSSFTSNNDSTTSPTINLPTIAGSKPLPRALQPKTNHQGVSAGYKPLFTGYGGSVLKSSDDGQGRRSSMICTTTFKSQCSLSRPSTAKGSAEHSTPLRHRNSVQVECPTSVREVLSSKPDPTPTTIHVSKKRSGVDNGSIFLSLGDVFGKRDPVEEMRKSEEVVMRNLGRHCKDEGRPDPPSSTVSRAFISLQGANTQKGNSSVDATNLDLSWSSSYGKQKVPKDGVILARPSEHFPGTIRLFLNSDDKQDELEKNSNGGKEIDPSPIQVVTTKRNQVIIAPAGDHISSHQMKTSTRLETFPDTPCGVVRSSEWKHVSTASRKSDVTSVSRDVPADEGRTEESKTSFHPGSTPNQFKESHRRNRISSTDGDEDDDDDDNDEAYRDGADRHGEGADDVNQKDEMNREKCEPHYEKVSKEHEARANEKCHDDDDDDDDHKNVVVNDDYKNLIDSVCKNEIDDDDDDDDDDEVSDVVGKVNEIISHEGVGIKDFRDDNDVGDDSDVVRNEVEVPVSFLESFVENGETIQAERSTCSIEGSMTSEETPDGNQSTVKSNEIHELIGKRNFSEDSILLTRVEHGFGSDDSGCDETTTSLFIEDSHDQKEDAKNDNKESTTTTKHDKQLRRNCELIDNSVECLPFKVEGIQHPVPRNSTLRTSGTESSQVKGEVLNFDTTTVKLEKGFLGVGFCIEGGRASPYGDRPILIKRVVRGDVPLRAGDELLSVNGEEVSSMTSGQVWSLLKSLPDGVMVLELRRKE